MIKPYTYHLAWSKHNIHYYGVRISPKAEKDLWVHYFASSGYVNDFIDLNGEPDIIEVRRKFDKQEDAINWESKVLKRLKVRENEKWLNHSDNQFNGSSKPKSKQHKRKIGLSNKKWIAEHPEEHQIRMLKINKNAEKIKKMADKHRGMKRSDNAKTNMSFARKLVIQKNGGKPLNHGTKQYYDPIDPIKNHIQCFPNEKPENWIEGNWKSVTKIIGTATKDSKFGLRMYQIHEKIYDGLCTLRIHNSLKMVRTVKFDVKEKYIESLLEYGYTINLY